MMHGLASMVTVGWTPGPLELIIIALIGLLIFGRRLPEVGRSVGQGIVEFKRGLSGMSEKVEDVGKKAQLENQEAGEPSGSKGEPTGKAESKASA